MRSGAPERIGIILGARVRPDGSASPALQRRAEHGVKLMLEGQLDRLIVTGATFGAPHSEAWVMQQICLARGVNMAQVTLEEHATTTLENLRFSMPHLPDNCAVTLITDRYHAPRAQLIARRLGLQVTMSPAPLGKVPKGRLVKARLREALAYTWAWLTLRG